MLEFAVSLLIAAGPTTHKPRTVVPPMFYSEIVSKAHLITTGTVTKIVARYERGKETIATYVTLGNLGILKGKAGTTVTLRLEGGKIGEDTLKIPLMPQFKLGARYLVYVDGIGGKKISPIVGFFQGCFEIVTINSREVLLNMNGDPLVGIEKDRFVFAAKPITKVDNRPELVKESVPFKPAAKDADAKEAAQTLKNIKKAKESRKPLRYESRPVGKVVLRGPGEGPPQKRRPTPGYDSRRQQASPKIITPENDNGQRASIAGLVSLGMGK